MQKSVFLGGVSTKFSKKTKLSSRWRTRLEKVFSKMLHFPGDEKRRKFDACFKRYAPQKVGFFLTASNCLEDLRNNFNCHKDFNITFNLWNLYRV